MGRDDILILNWYNKLKRNIKKKKKKEEKNSIAPLGIASLVGSPLSI